MKMKIFSLVLIFILAISGIGAINAVTTQVKHIQRPIINYDANITTPYWNVTIPFWNISIPLTLSGLEIDANGTGLFNVTVKGTSFPIPNDYNDQLLDLITNYLVNESFNVDSLSIKENSTNVTVPDFTATIDLVNGTPKSIKLPDTTIFLNTVLIYNIGGFISVEIPTKLPIFIPGKEYPFSSNF
ncbi:MAG: hypothetical protein LBT66_01730 [Methanobrevibacter sp.]|jgi:hypothetical protein|nr:hypothetical protein [Candidatus Methanovirga meridionalis]